MNRVLSLAVIAMGVVICAQGVALGQPGFAMLGGVQVAFGIARYVRQQGDT